MYHICDGDVCMACRARHTHLTAGERDVYVNRFCIILVLLVCGLWRRPVALALSARQRYCTLKMLSARLGPFACSCCSSLAYAGLPVVELLWYWGCAMRKSRHHLLQHMHIVRCKASNAVARLRSAGFIYLQCCTRLCYLKLLQRLPCRSWSCCCAGVQPHAWSRRVLVCTGVSSLCAESPHSTNVS